MNCVCLANKVDIEICCHMSQFLRMIYVLAYPKFAMSVTDSLAAFRRVHEPERAALVAPHITLVFGLRDSFSAEITALCEEVAPQMPEISVEFIKSEVIRDPFENTQKICLVTSVGTDRLTALHEQLYDGPHRRELNPDMPYQPHMTVATNADRARLEGIDVTPIAAFPIKATVDSLDVVKITGGKLTLVRSIGLGL